MNIIKIISDTTKKIGAFVDKHSPEILTGCGIAGFGATVILVAKEAPSAKERLDDLHAEWAENDIEMTKPKMIFEEAKTIAPIYWPAATTGIISVGCVLSAHRISTKRTAAWAAAYEVAQSNFVEYKNAVVEQIGEKKEKAVVDAICQKDIEKDPPKDDISRPVSDSNEVVITDGKSLFKFKCNGRYFRSTRDDIYQAVKKISDRLITEMWIPFNDLQFELGLDNTDDGDENGFWVENGIDVNFSSCIAPNGETCQVVIFNTWLAPDKRYM